MIDSQEKYLLKFPFIHLKNNICWRRVSWQDIGAGETQGHLLIKRNGEEKKMISFIKGKSDLGFIPDLRLTFYWVGSNGPDLTRSKDRHTIKEK